MPTPEQLANRETWRAALLSGDYSQGRRRLRTWNGETQRNDYCCLGVALDVIIGSDAWTDPRGGYFATSDGRENTGDMSNELFAELFDFQPDEVHPVGVSGFPEDDTQGLFIDANDNHKATFEQIAAMIPTQEGTP